MDERAKYDGLIYQKYTFFATFQFQSRVSLLHAKIKCLKMSAFDDRISFF